MRLNIAICLLLTLLCSCEENKKVKPSATSQKGESETRELNPDSYFAENSLWGEDLRYHSFESAYKTELGSVALGADDTIYYIYKDIDQDGVSIFNYSWDSKLHSLDSAGQEKIVTSRSARGVLKEIAVRNDGIITVAKCVEIDQSADRASFFLQLINYNMDASIAEQSLLSDPPSKEELYFYEIIGGEITKKSYSSLVKDGKPVLDDLSIVSMQWKGDRLYLLAYSYGVKIYCLSSDLELLWDQQVMPAYPWLWTGVLQNGAAFTVADDGSVFVAFELFGEDVDIYEEHFDRDLGESDTLLDIALSKFSADGDYLYTRLLGEKGVGENLARIFVKDENLYVAGSVRHKKFDFPNYTTEWDFLLMKLSSIDGEALSYTLVDFDREDCLYDAALLENGNILFAGSSGSKQVDSNSVVENGNGVVVEVSQKGEVLRSRVLREPRNVYIHSIKPVNNDQILFTCVYNAPITHTCDKDETLCYQDAAIGLITLSY